MYIININANMFHNDEDALDTTRFTSQVCRSWRNVILNNESLWGHMINIGPPRTPFKYSLGQRDHTA